MTIMAFRPLKRAALQAFQRTGGFNLVADSDWRPQPAADSLLPRDLAR